MGTAEIEATVGAVQENFRFLVLEVRRQLEETRRVMHSPEASREKLFARDDYIDNLKSVIENKCFRLLGNERLEKRRVDAIRSINVATANLERIGDFAVNIVAQLQYLDEHDVLMELGPDPFFEKILEGFDLVENALLDVEMPKALALCRIEVEVDKLYETVFGQIMEKLRSDDRPEPLVTSLFIFRYFERMGDSLLNVGEAAIFAAVGERLKIGQYQALEETLHEVDLQLDEVDYEGIWETRSGARIGTLHTRNDEPGGGRWIIFKEGRKAKILEEKEGLERWQAVRPGLPPRVFGYHEHGRMASLLMEYLEGTTLQKLTLEADAPTLKSALTLAFETIGDVWAETFEPKPSKPRFVKQIQRRLPDVLKVHPEFQRPAARIGALELPSFDDLLERIAPLDVKLVCPFSVLIHGDFNTDNLIINPSEREVHFIDLHRSKPFDYVQDVSVFMVSNFRTPVFEPTARARLEGVSLQMLQFARDFAASRDDHGFEARLALGRSLLTSTRFEIKEDFSRAMFLRALFLIERLIDHDEAGRDFAEFTLPDEVTRF